MSRTAAEAPSDTLRLSPRLKALLHEFRVSLAPQTPGEAALVRSQIAAQRQSTRHLWLVMPAMSLVLGLSYLGFVPGLRLFSWWLALSLACLLSPLVRRRFVDLPPRASPQQVARAAWIFTGYSLLVTLLWALIMPVLWQGGGDAHNLLLVLVIAASMTAGSSMNAAHAVMAALTLILYGLVLLLTPMLADGQYDLMLSFLVISFTLVIGEHTIAQYRTHRRLLTLQEEREVLFLDLLQAKSESDQARERAERASRAKSQFLANMSHELRTPLNAILGFSEMIETGVLQHRPGKTTEYAHHIHHSGSHLLRLINDVLDLAKIEAGRAELSESPVALHALLADSLNTLEPRAGKAGLHLRCACEPGLPPVFADDRALRQILLNLLSNAIKFTPPGGMVTAFARRRGDGAIVLGVCDTGIGMDASNLEQLFESFGQTRHDITTAERGTGLGLAIVKGLIEAHGGSVALTSTPGEGTEVSAILPASRCLPTARCA